MKLLIAALAAFFVATMSVAQEPNWSIEAMNEHIDQTNFIVGNHCSATLISVESRLLLTNQHCVTQYLRTRTRQVVSDEGIVSNEKYEHRMDVPVSQRVYDGHRAVGQMSFSTQIVGHDEGVDLALLQFRAETIPNTAASEIFRGDKVHRGEVVYAVGNPLGLDATLTKGVISSTSRRIQVGRSERNYFQMDAGIAGGNSGGALYNSVGHLIAVPAAAARGTMIGLAIPYNDIMEFLRANCFAPVFGEPQEDCE